jgi:CheY-like chemotaxis protein/HPt (histidine-containing phosphotransfer) domain-containing protein
VLVVDDHPVNRLVTVAQLAQLGYAAADAESGEAALDALAREPWDAVLLDCEMPPGLDGYETCRRLRRSEQNGRHTWVIALTSYATAADREQCLAAGMDDHLVKPVRIEELAAALDRWLEGAREPGPGTLPKVDADRLEERLAALKRLGEETGEELREQVVESFLQQGARDLAAMRQALARGDGAALAAAAHSLAGSAGILGATGLAMACAGLEELARRQDLGACGPRLEPVEQGYRSIARRLTA